ncbi:type II toxin-antitoxin system death-on-curing family toxin [Pinibacter soli]|uniref:Type II toxin-antitoxin system death-on-curing family toxin n=1 Tax=Pinibacter soli TaxID=3044211 RepID=A0ABT6RC85_9BACT|nr:type II toxin-antitoxin system death-on-curing family toxin [Pinibacter soli]MDI3320178.1 type II toxin-antitoxin system death-on-curing family toxin [Pinibacter soli]
MDFNYFPSDCAIKIHDKIILLSGGKAGIKDIGNIDSILVHIQNDVYYPTFEEKLTHLIFSFNKSHAFSDGNKRTSIALGAFFLELNGLDFLVDKFIIEMENLAVTVADNIIDKELLQEIVTSLISEEDYSEVLKLKIVNALERVSPDCEQLSMGTDFYKDSYSEL